jgi:phosphoserine aminotransferase
MTKRIYNFSAGPAILPAEVLEKAQRELLSLNGIGMSVMEISHRSEHFEPILASAKQNLRELLGVPANYQILFLQGGASLQFSMIPQNFLPESGSADYVVTGAWGEKAVKEARKFGSVNVVFSSQTTGFKSVPAPDAPRF